MVALVEGAIRSVSPLSDSERVGVVGQDRPFSPDLLSLVALQAGSVQPVAAFEVADPTLGAGSVARQPAPGVSGGGFLVASDEHCLGTELGERGVGGGGLEPAIDCDLPWCDLQAGELGNGGGQQRVLARVADLMRGRQD